MKYIPISEIELGMIISIDGTLRKVKHIQNKVGGPILQINNYPVPDPTCEIAVFESMGVMMTRPAPPKTTLTTEKEGVK
jgi:hypothetical protein